MEQAMINKRHEQLTGKLSYSLACDYGYSEQEARRVMFAAKFHDIGKAKIPDNILLKPGKLTPSEYEIVKLHTVYGYHVLQSVVGSAAEMMKCIALFHHERYDGLGYWKLTREQQPIYLRIVSIADVFCALISERVYKQAMPVEKALEYMEQSAGTQFDPILIGLFVPLVIRELGSTWPTAPL